MDNYILWHFAEHRGGNKSKEWLILRKKELAKDFSFDRKARTIKRLITNQELKKIKNKIRILSQIQMERFSILYRSL